jgi:hypothetical protein
LVQFHLGNETSSAEISLNQCVGGQEANEGI